jgi:peptidyl-prolyl cis-trans isomerase C
VSLVLPIALVAGACTSSDDQPNDEYTVATVDGEQITARWYRQTYFDFLVRSGANDTRGNRYLHLDNLIDIHLMAAEARRRGMAEDSLARVFFRRERKQALGGRFYEEELLETVDPLTDEEIRRAFSLWKSTVEVRHLFYLDPDSADAAYGRLQAGRGFLEEARDCYGLAEIDSSAGFLGPISYFMVDDAFAEAAFSLQAGEYSRPVKSRLGYHIIRAERVIRSPLLTESEYQTRKGGIGKRARIRKTRLAGDRFVRDYMEGVNVTVNAPAVRALNVFLREAETHAERQPVPLTGSEQDSDYRYSSLDPDAPLATYTWQGQERTFTLADYVFWLPTLPYAERRSRTGASIGRAIRNEVFAAEGERLGYDDAQLERSVRREGALFLARRLRDQLRADTTVRPTEEQLREAFERFGLDQRELVTADFWMIPAESVEEAERLRSAISAGADPAQYEGFTRLVNADLEMQSSELRYFVRQAPMARTTVVGLSDNRWIVLHVSRRESRTPDFEDSRPTLERRLQPYIAEYNLLRELRSAATMEVDTTRFEQAMAFAD